MTIRFRSGVRPLGLTLLLFLAAGAGRVLAQEAEPPEAATQETEPQYLGTEMCQMCHEDIYQSFQTSPHRILETNAKRGWTERACESCHGPGGKHGESMEAADIINPVKLTPMAADENCLECHLNEPTHIGRIRGSHARNQVSCVACHTIHGEAPPIDASQPERINKQCAECHADVWASFRRPHAHRLAEGAMSCLDCHNPHGSFFPRSVRTVSANEPGCFRCHGDKRGPFVFEHAPVRFEGCGSCHEPHGSSNPRMLNRHEVSNVCLECHSNIYNLDGTSPTGTLGGIAPGFHDLRNPRFRNCTICHIKIHGSQVNREFLR